MADRDRSVGNRDALPVERVDWIVEEDWQTIVENSPIPSVDLVVCHDGGVVLAKRTNQPAKGEWFVPGGRIQKGEPIEQAVHRVARGELGVDVRIRERLGSFDHFYPVSDVAGADKHYIAHGFAVEYETETLELDTQHEAVRVVNEIPGDVHEYVDTYLRAADALW